MPKESEREKLYRREVSLAQTIHIGSNGGGELIKVLGLPGNVKGLTIIDVGAGASGLAAVLMEKGAIVRAVDPEYYQPKTIESRLARVQERLFKQLDPSILELAKTEWLRGQEQFRESFRENPEVYIPGYATHLPFEDNFADFVVSSHAVIRLALQPDVFEAAIMEAIRVTKPGGTVILSPWHTDESEDKQQQFVHQHRKMVEKLNTQGHKKVEVKRPPSGIPLVPSNLPFLLRIVK